MLGRARQVKVQKENTIIVDGEGSSDAISARVGQIRKAIETTTSDYDKEKLQERLAKLAGGVEAVAGLVGGLHPLQHHGAVDARVGGNLLHGLGQGLGHDVGGKEDGPPPPTRSPSLPRPLPPPPPTWACIDSKLNVKIPAVHRLRGFFLSII